MIVVVGNRLENEDVSHVVDSSDLVIRISKMCNLDSGKTGTRTDWVVLAPNWDYYRFPPARGHWGVLRKVKRIYINGYPGWSRTFKSKMSRALRARLPVYDLPCVCNMNSFRMTTTAKAVRLAAHIFPNATIGLAAADTGDEWIRHRCNSYHGPREVEYYDLLLKSGKLVLI